MKGVRDPVSLRLLPALSLLVLLAAAPAAAAADTDGDGLSDATENLIGTNPSDPDTDDDGLLDGQEICTGIFGAANEISTAGDDPSSIVATDVDGDGDLDVLAGSANDDTIAWLENDGTPFDGTWTEHVISTGADGARSVAAADMDGDGDTDALSASFDDDTIAWYENDGTPALGPWTEHAISTAANGAISVRAADVDGDGDMDALSASYLGDVIAWHENDGTPAVGAWPEHAISTLVNDAQSALPADVDGDGDTDVVAGINRTDFAGTLSESTVTIAWYENDGTPGVGTWTERAIHAFGPPPSYSPAYSPFPADVDGDGDIDVAAQYSISAGGIVNRVAWYENDGTPAVGGWPFRLVATPIDAIGSTFATDVDGDGDTDLIAPSTGGVSIAWYENDGTPAVGTWVPEPISTVAGTIRSTFAADMDGDGDMDVLAAYYNDDAIRLFEQRNVADPLDSDSDDDGLGDGFEVNIYGTNPFVADSDGDGLGDGVEVSVHSTSPILDDTDADGLRDGFEVASGFDPLNADEDADGRVDGQDDFDADGLGNAAEALAGTSANDSDTDDDGLLDGQEIGTGTFGTQLLISTSVDYAVSVVAADVDGDGDVDALSASYLENSIAWHENDGTPSVGSWPEHPIATALHSPSLVVAADVDGDGDVDALSVSSGSGKLSWFENDGTPSVGAWSEHQLASEFSSSGLYSLFPADLDGDGDLDVLATFFFGSEIVWYENDGTPSSGNWTQRAVATGGESASVVAADVDSDGDSDVVVSSYYNELVTWYENDGTPAVGPWAAHSIATTTGDSRYVAAADVDGDGDTDVVSTRGYPDGVVWFENDGTPAVDTWPVHAVTAWPGGSGPVFTTDVDGDGDTDLLVPQAGTVAWYENDGTPAAGLWTEHVVSTAVSNLGSVAAADLDGDGDADVLSASAGDDKIAWYEQQNVADPLDPDSDDDGLVDGAEVNVHGSDPLDADTDDDGLSDGAEVNVGTDPTVADTDGDVWLDGSDNCPVTANPTQSDIGGVGAGTADGIGDACQCGDVDDDGNVDSADVGAYRDSLANPVGLGLTPAGVAKCSVIGNAGPCEMVDVTVIQRTLDAVPLLPGIAQVCAAAGGP